MKTVMMTSTIAALAVAASAHATQTFSASGATPGDIQSTVDQFRARLGANNGVGGTFGSGRARSTGTACPMRSRRRMRCRATSSTPTRRAA